jgi:hypothetical protein
MLLTYIQVYFDGFYLQHGARNGLPSHIAALKSPRKCCVFDTGVIAHRGQEWKKILKCGSQKKCYIIKVFEGVRKKER